VIALPNRIDGFPPLISSLQALIPENNDAKENLAVRINLLLGKFVIMVEYNNKK